MELSFRWLGKHSSYPYLNLESSEFYDYQFTFNGVFMKSGFTRVGKYYDYLGEIGSLKDVISLYLKHHLYKEIKEIQDKIIINNIGHIHLNDWQTYHPIYLILKTLYEGSNQRHIKELYTELPNNEWKNKYYLKKSYVSKMLNYLGVVKKEGNFLEITEKGKRVFRINQEGWRMQFVIRQRLKAERLGYKKCRKCDTILGTRLGLMGYSLCFNCGQNEAIARNNL